MSTYYGWPPSQRVETYEGVTDGAGQFAVAYPTPFNATPNVNPQCQPPANSTTRVRVIARDRFGFTVQTETNPGLSVLTVTVLGLATTPVATVAVAVLVNGN